MRDAYEWLKATCGEDSYREIARRAALSDSILSRQLSATGQVSFDVAIAIARAYDASPLAALIANGYLTPDEAGISSVDAALASATDEQLVVEIGRRLDITPASLAWDTPISEAVERATANVGGGRQTATVHYTTFTREPFHEDELAVASPRSYDETEHDEYDESSYDA